MQKNEQKRFMDIILHDGGLTGEDARKFRLDWLESCLRALSNQREERVQEQEERKLRSMEDGALWLLLVGHNTEDSIDVEGPIVRRAMEGFSWDTMRIYSRSVTSRKPDYILVLFISLLDACHRPFDDRYITKFVDDLYHYMGDEWADTFLEQTLGTLKPDIGEDGELAPNAPEAQGALIGGIMKLNIKEGSGCPSMEFEEFPFDTKEHAIKINLYDIDGDTEGIWAVVKDKSRYNNDRETGWDVAILANQSLAGIPWGSFIPIKYEGQKRAICRKEWIDTGVFPLIHSDLAVQMIVGWLDRLVPTAKGHHKDLLANLREWVVSKKDHVWMTTHPKGNKELPAINVVVGMSMVAGKDSAVTHSALMSMVANRDTKALDEAMEIWDKVEGKKKKKEKEEEEPKKGNGKKKGKKS